MTCIKVTVHRVQRFLQVLVHAKCDNTAVFLNKAETRDCLETALLQSIVMYLLITSSCSDY